MPAAAVIRGMQALSGITGRKECVGCLIYFQLKRFIICNLVENIIKLESVRGKRNFFRSSEMQR